MSKKQNLPDGARGLATLDGIKDHHGSVEKDGGGDLFVPCHRCGQKIKDGDPVTWSTQGKSKGLYACPRSLCKSPPGVKTSKKVRQSGPSPQTQTPDPETPSSTQSDEEVQRVIEETVRKILGNNLPPQTVSPKTKTVPGYLVRPIDKKVETLIEDGKTNFLLIGGSGSGKTECAKYLAQKYSVPGIVFSMSIDNPIKEILVTLSIKNGDTVRVPGELVERMKDPGVICVDEFNLVPPKYIAKFYELLSQGKLFLPELGQTITKHKDCILIFTANPSSHSGYRGTESFSNAFLERVKIIKFPDFTKSEIVKLTGCSKDFAKWVDHLRVSLDAIPSKAIIGVRLIMEILDDIRLFGLKEALSMLDDTLNEEDGRVQNLASRSALDFFPELTGDKS